MSKYPQIFSFGNKGCAHLIMKAERLNFEFEDFFTSTCRPNSSRFKDIQSNHLSKHVFAGYQGNALLSSQRTPLDAHKGGEHSEKYLTC
jgi:hypothetical protein